MDELIAAQRLAGHRWIPIPSLSREAVPSRRKLLELFPPRRNLARSMIVRTISRRSGASTWENESRDACEELTRLATEAQGREVWKAGKREDGDGRRRMRIGTRDVGYVRVDCL